MKKTIAKITIATTLLVPFLFGMSALADDSGVTASAGGTGGDASLVGSVLGDSTVDTEVLGESDLNSSADSNSLVQSSGATAVGSIGQVSVASVASHNLDLTFWISIILSLLILAVLTVYLMNKHPENRSMAH